MLAIFSGSFAVRSSAVHLNPSVTEFTAKFGYKEEDIVMLTDDARNPRQLPTRDNIVMLSPRDPI